MYLLAFCFCFGRLIVKLMAAAVFDLYRKEEICDSMSDLEFSKRREETLNFVQVMIFFSASAFTKI